MTSATVGGKTTNYTYDAAGNRIGAVTGTGAEQVVQNWNWDVNARPPGAGPGKPDRCGRRRRARLPVRPGRQPLALLGPRRAHSYLHDWLGGVAGMVSPNGTQEWAYDYDAVRRQTGGTDKLSGDAPANPLQYAGSYHDVSQGDRYAMGARNYDPGTGRFDATDPASPSRPRTRRCRRTRTPTPARPSLTDPTGVDPDPGGTPYFGGLRSTNPQHAAEQPDAADTEHGGGERPRRHPDRRGRQPGVAEREEAGRRGEGFVKQIGDEIVNLILDLVGFNDAKKCVTEGDIVACISTALQAVPWGKVFKAAKVAIKAVGVGRRLIEAYGQAASRPRRRCRPSRNGSRRSSVRSVDGGQIQRREAGREHGQGGQGHRQQGQGQRQEGRRPGAKKQVGRHDQRKLQDRRRRADRKPMSRKRPTPSSPAPRC